MAAGTAPACSAWALARPIEADNALAAVATAAIAAPSSPPLR